MLSSISQESEGSVNGGFDSHYRSMTKMSLWGLEKGTECEKMRLTQMIYNESRKANIKLRFILYSEKDKEVPSKWTKFIYSTIPKKIG